MRREYRSCHITVMRQSDNFSNFEKGAVDKNLQELHQ